MRLLGRYLGLLFVGIFLFVVLVDDSFSANYTKLSYALDHSKSPPLYYNDVTLKIQVGPTSSIVVMGDGESLPYRYDTNSGELIVTTDGDLLDIYVADASVSPEFGTYEVTELYDDKSWAWSQGFDDNVFLGDSIDIYKALGYQATVFLIGESVDPVRTEYWILDASSGFQGDTWVTGIKELAEMEWGIGNHGWGPSSSCNENGDLALELLQNHELVLDIVAQSNNPSYKPISVAAPCFLSEYQGVLLDLRDNGVSHAGYVDKPFHLIFNESGDIYAPYIIDSESDFTAGDITAYSFEFDVPVSRDYQIEYDPDEIIRQFDWMAANAGESRHFWYNTLAHGDNEDSVGSALFYAHENYGRAGTDEAWIAPSDRIYSYLINKALVEVSFLGYEGALPPEDLAYHPYGSITLDGLRVSNRTNVTILVSDDASKVLPIQNYFNVGNGAYQADLDGTNGDLVSFGFNGYEIAETAVFDAGKFEQVDLTNGAFRYDDTRAISGAENAVFLGHDRNLLLLINANGQDLGNTKVSVRANQDCTISPDETVQRCFNITPENRTEQSATITFYFYNSQIPEGQSCEDMEVYNYENGRWTELTRDISYGVNGRSCQSAPYTTPHSIQVSGVSAFSPFVVAESNPTADPTAVTLNTFTLNAEGNWQVALLLGVLLLTLFTGAFYWRFKQGLANI